MTTIPYLDSEEFISKHSFVTFGNLVELEVQNKIYLELSFQSIERWSDKQRREYIKSILRGSVPTPIVLAHIESCMNYCAKTRGEDSEDYIYFKSLFDDGFTYISVDGNNRTKGCKRFKNDEFALSLKEHSIPAIKYANYKKWSPKNDNRTYRTLPAYVRDHLDQQNLCVYIIKDADLERLHQEFRAINSGMALNDQEWRNSFICDLAPVVRDIPVQFPEFFDKYWTEKGQRRRKHEQWIVTCFVHATRSGNIDKKERDAAYDNLMPEYDNRKRVQEIIKIMARMCVKYDNNNVLKSEATLTDLFMFINWLFEHNYKINNERKLYEWFELTFLKVKNAKTTTTDPVTGKKKKTAIILYEDGNGSNVRDYVGAQRSTNLCHREARLGVYTVFGNYHEKYGDRLPELPEDVLIQKDSKRAFPVSFRFPLWEQQSGKCALTGIEIPQSDIFNGQKYVIDHKIPHAAGVEEGGTTTFENAQLVCYDENKNKSDKIELVRL